MSKLSMYYDGESEWVIAKSPEDALEIWCEQSGYDIEESYNIEFVPLPEDKPHSIYFDNMPEDLTDEEANEWLDQDPNNGWKKIEKTVGEWIEELGRGWCGSTETF